MQQRLLSLSLVSLFGWLPQSGCAGPDDVPVFDVADRAPGVRAPRSASCDDQDPTRCLLPFPSSTFTVKDPQTQTGLRLAVSSQELIAGDDAAALNRADGFSLVTPIVTAFAASVSALPVAQQGEGPLRLLLAQPGAADEGRPVPLRYAVEQGQGERGITESFVFAYPLRPLAPASDYVAVVLDDLPIADGARPQPSAQTLVALGLRRPTTQSEAELAAYHAPTRRVLQKAGIDPARVLRVWDFTTRSADDAHKVLATMRQGALQAVAAKQVKVVLDQVVPSSHPQVALTVLGHVEGLPQYIEPTPGSALRLDASGRPVVLGSQKAPFRVVIPAGTGSYRFIMFGHGTGGAYTDSTFDTEIAGAGAAKVGIQFDGWTDSEVLKTLGGILKIVKGSHYATAMLMQAQANAAAIQALLPGALGDALSAPMLLGKPNPAAGRLPTADKTLWAGGSLGGIMGLVAVCADPALRYGVLNVPGAAWTHYIPKSVLFDMLSPLLDSNYRGVVNAQHALAMTQGIWDEVDGAAWASALQGREAAFLIQESIGDPVVPNAGSEMVAVVTAAQQVGAELSPIPAQIPRASEVSRGSAITQYKVADTGAYDIHGFAGRDTPAGRAARSQIVDFVQSIWQTGTAKITVPATCTGGSCDFSRRP
ncbi:MAG: hypothetical protein JNM40_18985 [Myxococcales bacterium]|nr:hypothetical protein [Myxococcales bacterium]